MTGGSGSGSGGTPSGGTANGKPPMQRMASSQSAVTISQGLSTATVPLSRTGSVSVIPETDDDGDNSKVRKSAPQFSRQPTHLGTSGLSITNETGLKIAQKLEMVSDKLDNIARAILNLPKKNDSVATAARIEAKKEENKKKKGAPEVISAANRPGAPANGGETDDIKGDRSDLSGMNKEAAAVAGARTRKLAAELKAEDIPRAVSGAGIAAEPNHRKAKGKRSRAAEAADGDVDEAPATSSSASASSTSAEPSGSPSKRSR